MDPPNFFRLKRYKFLFASVFLGYFFFFQIVARIFLITRIDFPQGVGVVVSSSPPVSPQDMPFPLWGPFLSITTPYFSWAMTPLSLGVSFLLSFLVALNITLYVAFYQVLKLRAFQSLVSSLGLIATSLSCSCEFFTAMIGSASSNLPLLFSTPFMERLFEGLVVLAGALLSLSTYVLYSEVKGRDVLRGLGRGVWTYAVVIASFVASLALPTSIYFSFVKFVLGILAGVGIASALGKRWRLGIPASFALVMGELSTFNLLYDRPFLLVPLSFASGFLAGTGFSSLRPWARLGILHVTAWSLIMPGPISILLGQPIPFFNFPADQLMYLWVVTWVMGTPLAWYAGVYYLQYLRSSSAIREVRIELPQVSSRDLGLELIVVGAVTVVVQVAYFLTHVPYYVDYNGFDLANLAFMTGISTAIITAGSVVMGYGVAKLVKNLFHLSRPKNWLKYSSVFAVFLALLSGVVHLGVYGYPYPPVLFGLFGIPMFEPSVTIYVPHVIGLYVYPLQVLQLTSASLMAGAIASYSLSSRAKGVKGLVATVVGPVAVCPMCTLSSFSAYSLGVIGAAMAGTYFSDFINSLGGQLALTFASQLVLLLFTVYYGRRSNAFQVAPRKATLRITQSNKEDKDIK